MKRMEALCTALNAKLDIKYGYMCKASARAWMRLFRDTSNRPTGGSGNRRVAARLNPSGCPMNHGTAVVLRDAGPVALALAEQLGFQVSYTDEGYILDLGLPAPVDN